MMDALISTFVAQIKEKMCSCPSDELDGLKNSNPSGRYSLLCFLMLVIFLLITIYDFEIFRW